MLLINNKRLFCYWAHLIDISSSILPLRQRISGIGNYLLAEGLYKAKVDPYASLNELSDDQYRVLFHKLRTTAQKSYRANGVTRASGGTYTDTYGEPGKFVFELECYGRDIASNHQPVIQDTNGPHGRTIWYTKEQLFMPMTQRHSLSTISSMETRSNIKPNLDSTSTFPISLPISGGTTAHLTSSLSKSSEVSSVEALSAYLTEPSWKEALSPYISSSDEFQMIASFLAKEYDQGITIFPPKHEIFAALNYCSLYNVKVVIVGQDPYFNPNQGHGLAFSVREGVPIPPSLKNIFKEAIADVGIRPPTSGCLESWAKQGVLLLNTVLTVRSGEPNSHAGKGWESFTDHILQTVNKELDGVVFLLWGAPAAKKAALVNRKKNHAVIQCSHPSPLSATKTKTPFLGSRCFSRVNAALDNLGEDEIDWNIT
jgi:uracil-DNA glycosylase